MDPYSGTAKLVVYALIVAAILGCIARWRYVEGELTDTRVAKAALEEQIAIRAKNANMAALVAKQVAHKTATRTASVEKSKEEIRRVQLPQTAPECLNAVADAYAGIDAALRGVLALEAESGRGPTAPAALVRSEGEGPEAHWLRTERETPLRFAGSWGLHPGDLE